MGGLNEYDPRGDVVPDTSRAVDIRVIGYGWGEFGPNDGREKCELFAFILRSMAPPFQGSDPTTVELFFDLSMDRTFGELTPPWVLGGPGPRGGPASWLFCPRPCVNGTEECQRTGTQWYRAPRAWTDSTKSLGPSRAESGAGHRTGAVHDLVRTPSKLGDCADRRDRCV